MRAVRALSGAVFAAALCAFGTSEARTLVPPGDVGFNIVEPDAYKPIRKGHFNGTLYETSVQGAVYSASPYVLSLFGTRYQHGYDFGYTQVDMLYENYNALLGTLFHPAGVLEPLARWLLEEFADWQWRSYLSVQVPKEYMEEFQGAHDGCQAAMQETDYGRQVAAHAGPGNTTSCEKLASRMVVLSNFPGTIKDIVYVLASEFGVALGSSDEAKNLREGNTLKKLLRHKLNATPLGVKARHYGVDLFEFITTQVSWPVPMQCSMVAAWGPRTNNGALNAGRNLDWLHDSGINKYKTIYVFHPPGKIAHATVGFAGLLGALTGMSAQGLTVHEANLESKQETFLGFPWLLRLRYIMENAVTVAEAKNLWMQTNNTVGFNHMVGSGHDASAIVFETEADYTAYFRDNDPREAKAVVDGVHTGFPLPNALWRTNHGYDPKIMRDFLWSQGPKTDTEKRYMIIHDAIVSYEHTQTPIDFVEMCNITALAGQKGDDYYVCGNTHSGSNVLSVAYHTTDRAIYAAWEAFSGASWRPAACNSYVKFDMTKWF